MRDNCKTIVIFRKFKDDGSIIALFPYEINYPNNYCESYMRIGQHSAADYNGVVTASIPAQPFEYESLKQELTSLGYNLEVRKRRQYGRN